jgi:hypothetical protein
VYGSIALIEDVVEKDGVLRVSQIFFPLVMVLTQDCDLAEDFKSRYGRPKRPTQDKFLLSVLVAPLYNLTHVLKGEHLTGLEQQMTPFPSSKKATERKLLKQNRTPRYHYIEFPPDVSIVPSVIDFKHYFSVSVQHLRKKQESFACRVDQLYRERISQRFATFLARIGLPDRYVTTPDP